MLRPLAAALGFSLLIALPAFADDETIPITITSRPIAHFQFGSDETRFGQLEFTGGLEMIGSSRHFGALSAINVFADQSRMLGVADTGFWFAGNIDRDADGHATGLSDVSMWRMDEATARKSDADAEGIAVTGDTVYVSFEQRHRIGEYRLPENGHPERIRIDPPPVPLWELRSNRGFETIAIASDSLAIGGALVGVAEKSLDRNGNMMGFVRFPDNRSFEFSVKRIGDYDSTDGKFLPDGDLVILERRFNIENGVGMRLRRIHGADIKKGATVDGEILMEADMRYQIDNMEGLSITIDKDGTPRLTLVSDDNHSILQRNLLLEFRLVGK